MLDSNVQVVLEPNEEETWQSGLNMSELCSELKMGAQIK